MGQVLNIVSFESIRATIGITETEFTDESLTALMLDEETISDLASWLPAGTSISNIIDGKDVDDPYGSSNLRYLALSGYVREFCALSVMSSAENWRLTKTSDGVINEERSDWANLNDVITRLTNQAATYKKRLLALLGTTPASAFSIMGKATPTSDPVTNT